MTEQKEQNFEQSLEQIRTIVSELESGELSLEDSISRYREGVNQIDYARKLIADAELRVKVLTEEGENDREEA